MTDPRDLFFRRRSTEAFLSLVYDRGTELPEGFVEEVERLCLEHGLMDGEGVTEEGERLAETLAEAFPAPEERDESGERSGGGTEEAEAGPEERGEGSERGSDDEGERKGDSAASEVVSEVEEALEEGVSRLERGRLLRRLDGAARGAEEEELERLRELKSELVGEKR